MKKWLWGFFQFVKVKIYGRDLRDVVMATKYVRVQGIRFRLKKLDPTAILDGSQVMLQSFGLYEKKKPENLEDQKPNMDKIKSHFRDMFMASVIEPKLFRKKEDADAENGIFVDYLFTEWELANDLYEAIVAFSYGKKKLIPSASRVRRSFN